MQQNTYTLAIDIGGTFTDIILARDDGALYKAKVGSTFDPVTGIIRGISDLLARHEIPAARILKVIHASTVATNTILEHKGARTALLTTAGFRDVLEIGRLRRPTLFDIQWEKPQVLVRRQLRLEVKERINYRGEIERPLDEAHALAQVRSLRALGVESVAVCLLHSYRNPVHERVLGEMVRAEMPGVSVSLSCEVLPEIREFERTSTTVVNAYIRPVVEHYLHSLERALKDVGIVSPLLMMQSNGGIVEARHARERPVSIVESGPAAGALAATYMARHEHIEQFISFDMGGTTAKATLVEGGEPRINPGCEVGAGMNASSRLSSTGAGYPIRVPSIDIVEVGSGGGSIAWIDKAGALRVGPQSAGADPGPACYGKGQEQPTVTDANVVLGYMNPENLAGGFLKIDHALAHRSVAEVAKPLGISVRDAALGIHLIANASMAKAVHAVTTERGRDPREFALVCFGGAGPVHAAMLALTMGMPRVIVPVAPGLFSAVGLLFADIRHDFLATVLQKIDNVTDSELRNEYSRLAQAAQDRLAQTGTDLRERVLKYSADLRYAGQTSEVTVAAGPLEGEIARQLVRDFVKEYSLTYGHKGERGRIELVNLRVAAVAPVQKVAYQKLARSIDREGGDAVCGRRRLYFGKSFGFVDAAVIPSRNALSAGAMKGPLVIEEFDTTILVPPGCTVHVGASGDVVVDTSRSEYQPADTATEAAAAAAFTH